MSKLTLAMYGGGPGGGTFVAQLVARPDRGEPSRRTLHLELGHPQEVVVEPGYVLVEVRLPSGELVRDERTIEVGRDEQIAFNLQKSRHEWLGWQQLLTGRPCCESSSVDKSGADPIPVQEISVHRPGRTARISVPLTRTAMEGVAERTVHDGRATYELHTDESTMSLTIAGDRGPRPLVEIVMAGGRREVVVPPLPWYDGHGQPLPVQMLLDFDAEGGHADLIVHDPVFSPMLAYYATGNRAAAQELAPEIDRHVREAIAGKFCNPCAATAGFLLMQRMRRAELADCYLENLASIECLADGKILHAQRMLEAKGRCGDLDRVRAALLEAVRRGPPIFAGCGRLLRDGLRRVAAAETEHGAAPTPEVAAALEWAVDLVYASRSDTIITWLAADAAALSRIVPSVVPAPPLALVPVLVGDRSKACPR